MVKFKGVGEMATVITVTSGNGGMGKSVFSCNIAYGLKSKGKRVALVEAGFGIRSDDVILGINPDTLFTIKDVCLDECELSDAITRPGDESLPHFICASPFEAPSDLMQSFKKMTDCLSEDYEYIIIDVSYSTDSAFKAAVNCSDIVILLTDNLFVSVRNTALCVNKIKQNSSAKLYLVLNNLKTDDTKSSLSAEDIIDETGAMLLGIIPHDEHVPHTASNGDLIFKYQTIAGRALDNICLRLLGNNVPDYETGDSGRLFNKNKLKIRRSLINEYSTHRTR